MTLNNDEQELDKQWRITYETVIRAKSSRGFNTRNGKVRPRLSEKFSDS